MIRKNDLTRTCAVLMMILLLTACERASQPQIDPREAFVGTYSFVSTGSVDIFADGKKLSTIPMNQQGELSIELAQELGEVMVIAENDTSIGHVSANYLYIDPITVQETFGQLDLTLSFTYGKATLSNKVLSFPTNVSISAVYQDKTLSGSGQVDITAIKK